VEVAVLEQEIALLDHDVDIAADIAADIPADLVALGIPCALSHRTARLRSQHYPRSNGRAAVFLSTFSSPPSSLAWARTRRRSGDERDLAHDPSGQQIVERHPH